MDPYFVKVILAAVIGGASISLMGTVIVGMKIPFLGIYISHGAMVGAVFGSLLGLPEIPSALIASLVSGLVLGTMTRGESGQSENVAVGILFSVSMALVFLGMGLSTGSKAEMLQLMWGSILLVTRPDLWAISVAFVAIVVFYVLFFKEVRAIVFSRVLAAASGIRETFVWALFLVIAALTITSNIRIVGGLMIFSLITNPPAAAFRLCRGFAKAAVLSSVFGAVSGLAGFLISYYFDLPTGACIALFSAAIFAVAAILRRLVIRDQ